MALDAQRTCVHLYDKQLLTIKSHIVCHLEQELLDNGTFSSGWSFKFEALFHKIKSFLPNTNHTSVLYSVFVLFYFEIISLHLLPFPRAPSPNISTTLDTSLLSAQAQAALQPRLLRTPENKRYRLHKLDFQGIAIKSGSWLSLADGNYARLHWILDLNGLLIGFTRYRILNEDEDTRCLVLEKISDFDFTDIGNVRSNAECLERQGIVYLSYDFD
jgi:hypothetical protein